MNVRRLLIVEDDLSLSEVLCRAFERRGYEVHAEMHVAGACRAACEWPSDCAVVDLKLPDGSGLKVVEALATAQPDCRIVVMTGYASVATAVEAIKLGATHYLTKPASIAEIEAAFDRTEGDAEAEAIDEPMRVDAVEWEYINRVLTEQDGNISATARALGMHRRTLQRKLARPPES